MARVKEYRYTLQLYFQEELQSHSFSPRSSSKRLYQNLFLNMPQQNSKNWVCAFQAMIFVPFMSASTQKKVYELFIMTLMRRRSLNTGKVPSSLIWPFGLNNMVIA